MLPLDIILEHVELYKLLEVPEIQKLNCARATLKNLMKMDVKETVTKTHIVFSFSS
jgi:hypothetical protein